MLPGGGSRLSRSSRCGHGGLARCFSVAVSRRVGRGWVASLTTLPGPTRSGACPNRLRRPRARRRSPSCLAAAPTRRSRSPVTEDVRRGQVVPRAALAHLDDVDPELAVLAGHRLQLGRRLDPARVLAELVAVHVGHVRQRSRRQTGQSGRSARRGSGPRAAGTGGRRRRPVAARPPGAAEQRVQRRAPGQRVVDHRPLGPHPRAYDRAGRSAVRGSVPGPRGCASPRRSRA